MENQPLIAVVDDEVDILDNYKTLLGDDYRVISYQDPQSFLKAMDDSKFSAPDLLITDLKMPAMDGIEMVRRAQKKGFSFPFILLSGYLNKKSAIEAVDVGVFRLLEKPTEFDVIASAIDQLLIEHDIHKVRLEIRTLTSKLRELYSSIRLALNQYIPEDVIDRVIIDAPNGKVEQKMGFEELLETLESRLDVLLTSEKVLNEMRQNKLRA